jgi:hypothetical protein
MLQFENFERNCRVRLRFQALSNDDRLLKFT